MALTQVDVGGVRRSAFDPLVAELVVDRVAVPVDLGPEAPPRACGDRRRLFVADQLRTRVTALVVLGEGERTADERDEQLAPDHCCKQELAHW
jgi:hypothetical protein